MRGTERELAYRADRHKYLMGALASARSEYHNTGNATIRREISRRMRYYHKEVEYNRNKMREIKKGKPLANARSG